MSTTTAPRTNSLTAGQLPKPLPYGIFVLAIAAAAGIVALAAEKFSVALTVVLGVLLFFIAMFVASLAVEGNRRAVDRLARYVVTSFFVIALLPLISLLWETIVRGIARFDLQFFSNSMYRVIEADEGGIVHAVYGTLIVTGIAALISIPIGLLTSIYLVEYSGDNRVAGAIRFFVDVMTGIPSIVAGLFAYTVISSIFGPGTYNGFSGAIALSILMIPTVVRSSEEMLRIVPNELREASYALGVPKYRTIIRIVLPTALAGLVTGVILAIARVIGETAPLLITTGSFKSVNLNPFHNQMETIPIFVYSQAQQPDWVDRAWAGALTLIIIVMVLNAIGRFISWKFAPKGER